MSFSCSGSPFSKPRSRVTCLHQADGQPSRGRASCAIKLARSVSIPRRRSRGSARPHVRFYWAKLTRFTATQIAAVGIGLRRGLGQDQPAPNARRISIRSAQHERAAMHRVPRLAAVFGSLHQARSNRLPSAVAVRSPPTAITRESGCCLLRGPGFEKLQLLDRDPVFCTILHRFLKSCDEGELQRLV